MRTIGKKFLPSDINGGKVEKVMKNVNFLNYAKYDKYEHLLNYWNYFLSMKTATSKYFGGEQVTELSL